jgi:hypothetical protein
MRHSVTTPGGFFIGIGGIATALIVAGAIYAYVSKPGKSTELLPQQEALGLAIKAEDKANAKSKQAEIDKLLADAGARYNGGNAPDISKLDDLRGVVRFREARKSVDNALAALNAPSSVNGPDGKPLSLIAASMQALAKDIQARKPAPSQVKVDIMPPAEAGAPTMPSVVGNGVKTVIFTDPNAPKPAKAPDAAAAPKTSSAAPAPATTTSAPAPNRPPLLNSAQQ